MYMLQATLSNSTMLSLPAEEFKVSGTLATFLTLDTDKVMSPSAFCIRYRRHLKDMEQVDTEHDISINVLREGPGNGDGDGNGDADDDKDDDDDDEKKIARRFVGLRDVPFENLQEPLGTFQVRPINETRVQELVKDFLDKRQSYLSSNLTVMEIVAPSGDDDSTSEFMIIDGGHRYRAMKEIRESNMDVFKVVPCLVYRELTTSQVLSTGYRRNTEAASVYKMTDFDTVEVVRKIMKENKDDQGMMEKVHQFMGCNDANEEKKEMVGQCIYLNSNSMSHQILQWASDTCMVEFKR